MHAKRGACKKENKMKSSDVANFLRYIIHQAKERGQRHSRLKAHKGQQVKEVIRRRKRRRIPKPQRHQGGRENRGRNRHK